MSRIYTSVDQLIGGTPLLELTNFEKKHDAKAKILAKLDENEGKTSVVILPDTGERYLSTTLFG